MDGSGFLHDIKKITLEENLFTLRNFVIKKQTEECPLKSEGHQNTTSPELTKIKLKGRLEGKDAAVIISEDGGNNSFLQKSEEQDGTTENSRNIPETSERSNTYKNMRQQKTTQICLTQKGNKHKTTHTFLTHQKREMKSKKTTQEFKHIWNRRGNNTGRYTHI